MYAILLLFLVYRGSALPMPSTDAYSTQANPDSASDISTRTTYEIFWSCITTIFACTWVAVHPDIPNARYSDRKIFWHRMRILVVALIAPEYIVTWAASQLHLARKAVRRLRHIHSCKDWTLTHGMFLVMGGFMLVDTSGNHLEPIRDAKQLASLLEKNIVIVRRIPSSEIMDRSKSDGLAKVLVLIQTSWFLVQVISRAVMHLPITELELTTVAFALLNFLTYACWWKKPLDVRYPILIPLQPRPVLPSPWSSLSQTYSSGTLDVQLQDYNQSGPIQDKGIDNTDFIEAINGAEDSLCSSSSAVDREAEDAESIDAEAIRLSYLILSGVFPTEISFSHINTLSEATVLSSDDTVTASESFESTSCPLVISSPTQAMNEAPNDIFRPWETKGCPCSSTESSIVDVEQDITDVGFRLDTSLKAGAGEEPSSESSHSHRQTHKTPLSGGLQGAFNKTIAILLYLPRCLYWLTFNTLCLLYYSRRFAKLRDLFHFIFQLYKKFYNLYKKFYNPDIDNLHQQNLQRVISPYSSQSFADGPTNAHTHALTEVKSFSLFSPMGLELCIGVLFGLVHCAAWNFQFPSAIEQHLWRIMSLCITGAPLVLLISKVLVYALLTPWSYTRIRYWILDKIWSPFVGRTQITLVVFVIYILARLTTFALAFTLLRDLSPGALQEVQWTTYIPHV